MHHLLDTDLLFYCHSSKVSLIPFPAPKFWTSVSYPHNRGLTFFFCFWNLPLSLGFFLKIFSPRQAWANYIVHTGVCSEGILSLNKWHPELRRLRRSLQMVMLLISLPLKQLKHFVLRRCCFSQETGTGRQGMNVTVQNEMNCVGLLDNVDDGCLRRSIQLLFIAAPLMQGQGRLEPIPADMRPEEGQHGTGHHTAQMMNK